MMRRITITRSGRAPLAFDGCLIAHADGQIVNGQEQTRWHTVSIYQTSDGKWVLHTEYHSKWKSEVGQTWAEKCFTPQEVVEKLEHFDPTEHVIGYPLGQNFEAKQKRLLHDVRQRFAAQVGEILSSEDFAVPA